MVYQTKVNHCATNIKIKLTNNMAITERLTNEELKMLKRALKPYGTQTAFCTETGISRGTIRVVKMTGEATGEVVAKIREYLQKEIAA